MRKRFLLHIFYPENFQDDETFNGKIKTTKYWMKIQEKNMFNLAMCEEF